MEKEITHIVLRKTSGQIQLGTNFFLPFEAVFGKLIFCVNGLYRIQGYNFKNSALILTPDGVANDGLFLTSAQDLDEWLLETQPQKIVIEKKGVQSNASVIKKNVVEINEGENQKATKYVEETFTERFLISTIETDFNDGFIRCKVFVTKLRQEIEVDIVNNNVFKIYDSVKQYFEKVIGEFFEIDLIITHSYRRISEMKVVYISSNEIDETTVQRVDEMQIEAILQKITENDIVNLHDLKIITANEESVEQRIFKHLVTEEKTKHYYHLGYLASRQFVDFSKLKITGRPHSFLFLIEDKKRFFFIWETYNTKEATYIWPLERKDKYGINIECDRLTETIKYLRKGNKLNYKKDDPEASCQVEHEYKSVNNGFTNWKKNFNETIDNFLKYRV